MMIIKTRKIVELEQVMLKNTFSINEIEAVFAEGAGAHNMIYRHKNLGTISSLNEYLTFRQEHGIADHSYRDLYIGDYFTILDGTYNVEWVVAHFDYYVGIGPNTTSAKNNYGVVLIPGDAKGYCGNITMGSDIIQGYANSLAHTTHCPAVGSALQRVLGSYLLQTNNMITDQFSTNIPSMSGTGRNGATTHTSWSTNYAILPTESQVFGAPIASSSWMEAGEAYGKLALFSARTPNYYDQQNFFTRNIAGSETNTIWSLNSTYGYITLTAGTTSCGFRPIVYIG